jgi:type VI secretion system protein ImpH
VRIEPYALHWMSIEAADRTRLGHARNRPERGAGVPAALGSTATAGHKLRDRQYKFRVALGPLTLAQYLAFLPGGRAWLQLRDWVRQYTGLDLLWDVQLCLGRADVPEPRLGRRVPLGVAAWLGRVDPKAARDRADLRLRPDTSFLLRHRARHA